MMKTKDLTGRIFGRWKVLYQVEDYVSPKGQHQPMWMCECQCEKHTRKPVKAYVLNRGESTSCGCYGIEAVKKSNSRENVYELINDDYYVGCTQSGKEFYFDKGDFDLASQYCWDVDNSTGYVKTIDRVNKTGKLYLHRLVMGCAKGDETIIDHKNGDKIDCRKNNLRFATKCQNNVNKSLRSDNTSGVTGVSWDNRRDKLEVRITIDNKDKFLGRFNDFTEAVKTRIEAEIKYFDEFIYKPHLKLLDYINNGGKLEYGNKEQIKSILKS